MLVDALNIIQAFINSCQDQGFLASDTWNCEVIATSNNAQDFVVEFLSDLVRELSELLSTHQRANNGNKSSVSIDF